MMEKFTSAEFPVPTTQELAKGIERLDKRLRKIEEWESRLKKIEAALEDRRAQSDSIDSKLNRAAGIEPLFINDLDKLAALLGRLLVSRGDGTAEAEVARDILALKPRLQEAERQKLQALADGTQPSLSAE